MAAPAEVITALRRDESRLHAKIEELKADLAETTEAMLSAASDVQGLQYDLEKERARFDALADDRRDILDPKCYVTRRGLVFGDLREIVDGWIRAMKEE